ncbi:MAG TPA: DHH family phosphoesterase [Verrucomicrobiae bacterium]|jgi:oligoribonuclease NrnB/cAMP/cGMP phosphodiesterase (DHH superfamily)
MIQLPKPAVILTHESDLDGYIAGVLLKRLARKLFDADVPLEAWNYNGWRNRPMNETAAWVTDLNFEARLDKPNWVIIDHHATELRPKTALLIHNVEKSASLLCYELCREHGLGSPALDRLVHLSNVADLFLEDDPDFVLANDYANLVKTYSFWNLHALIKGELELLIDHPLLEVMAVKRRIEDPIGLEWSKANVTRVTDEVGFVETVVGNTNLIIYQLLDQQATPFPVLVTAFQKSNGLIVLSLRSQNGGALKVAEKLKGGGHANAAGATLPRSVQSVEDGIAYVRQILSPAAPAGGGLNSLEQLFTGLGAVAGATDPRR